MKFEFAFLGVVTLLAGAAFAQVKPADPATTRPRAGTNAPIQITSQSVTHSNAAGVTIFTGNVRAWDEEMELIAKVMTVKFVVDAKTQARSIATILADGDVVILNKKDKSRALADKATYQAASDQVELTGHTLMESGGLLTTADKVIYDRTNGGVLYGQGNVKVDVNDPNLLNRTNRFNLLKPVPHKADQPLSPTEKKGKDR
jgi:lipopolysaccharide transport protein LptA